MDKCGNKECNHNIMVGGDCEGVNLKVEGCTIFEPLATHVRCNGGLSGPLTIPVKTVRKALECWLHIHIFKDDVKIKNMKFKTDGQVEITFE